jgi:hypothetical protein
MQLRLVRGQLVETLHFFPSASKQGGVVYINIGAAFPLDGRLVALPPDTDDDNRRNGK